MGYNTKNRHAQKGKEKRGVQLQYRVTEKEKAKIVAAASKSGLTISEYSGDVICIAAGVKRD